MQPDLPSRLPDWIADALEDAQRRGNVAFVAVVPVSPEFLRDGAETVVKVVGEQAARQIADEVMKWRRDDQDAS